MDGAVGGDEDEIDKDDDEGLDIEGVMDEVNEVDETILGERRRTSSSSIMMVFHVNVISVTSKPHGRVI